MTLVQQRAPLKTGIVHLGLGAFFRAHGAPFIQQAMHQSGGDWGIVGVCLKTPHLRDKLSIQNWRYHTVSQSDHHGIIEEITIFNDVLFAPENPQAVLNVMAHDDIKIVTLTVTEKGYCYLPSSGTLDVEHPDIISDLTGPHPVSAIGYLVHALQLRYQQGKAPFTILSCDNLPQNGVLLKDLVLTLADKIDPELARWIKENARFPSSMVDRITPATTQDDIAYLAQHKNIVDQAPVMHEPFAQWVIEDDFVNHARPQFEEVGVEMVHDVTAHETMKLRLLNGSHSALAYLGYLAGYQTISEVIRDEVLTSYLRRLWDEIIPSMNAPTGVSLTRYADQLYERYANQAIQHKTWQIAMDGSQKLPQRLLSTLQDNFDNGRDHKCLLLAVAGWMRYVTGRDEQGGAIDVRDPLIDKIRAQIATCDNPDSPASIVSSLLEMEMIFPQKLATQIEKPLRGVATLLWRKGALKAAEELIR